MAASEMRFSRSSPPDTRLICHTHSGEPPKHAAASTPDGLGTHNTGGNRPLDTSPPGPQRDA